MLRLLLRNITPQNIAIGVCLALVGTLYGCKRQLDNCREDGIIMQERISMLESFNRGWENAVEERDRIIRTQNSKIDSLAALGAAQATISAERVRQAKSRARSLEANLVRLRADLANDSTVEWTDLLEYEGSGTFIDPNGERRLRW